MSCACVGTIQHCWRRKLKTKSQQAAQEAARQQVSPVKCPTELDPCQLACASQARTAPRLGLYDLSEWAFTALYVLQEAEQEKTQAKVAALHHAAAFLSFADFLAAR